jgi:hypothetical protein
VARSKECAWRDHTKLAESKLFLMEMRAMGRLGDTFDPLMECPGRFRLCAQRVAFPMPVTSYFGSMQPCEATTCQRPFWFTKTSVHHVFPLMSFPLYVPLSLLL